MYFSKIIPLFILSFYLLGCQSDIRQNAPSATPESVGVNLTTQKILVGAERSDIYLPLLSGQSIAVVANATSVAGDQHLVDALLEDDVVIRKIFVPEHGFRGLKDAGETINNEIDAKTGLQIISLYGTNKKPTPELLSDVDVMVFDLQDVGVRFYTYLSTLHYVMESCAETDTPLIVFDRPNPNAHYVDGPVLKPEYSSFIGLHPVPLVYGMTIGEYAQMINGEGWLDKGVQCDLTIIELENYSHDTPYSLPIKPSPNLPNMEAVYLYPSLALFEGTTVSIGRGTDVPFQIVGHPDYPNAEFSFTPRPVPGAMSPKLDGQLCYGLDLRKHDSSSAPLDAQLSLDWIIDFYAQLPDKETFFLANNFFHKLAGNDVLMTQIKVGLSADDIKLSWQADLTQFQTVREKYLIYK